MSYHSERYDLVKLLKKIYESNDIFDQRDFADLIDKYMDYVQTVVEHVSYESIFTKYGSDFDSRCEMEMYNIDRTKAHNRAIEKTLAFQAGVLRRYKMIFCEKCIGKKKLSDFSSIERRQLGEFIFSTISTCATLTEKEIETIGVDKAQLGKQFVDLTSSRKRRLEARHNTTITENIDDVKYNMK